MSNSEEDKSPHSSDRRSMLEHALPEGQTFPPYSDLSPCGAPTTELYGPDGYLHEVLPSQLPRGDATRSSGSSKGELEVDEG